jgi:DNA-binding response OmpR family regulator
MSQRIMVVDDDPNALRLISYALHREGLDVVIAGSGQEALRLLEEQVVDLMVLDVMMPQMDGLEVCRRLRANPKTIRLPVIMLTAKAQVEDKIRGFEVGADDYITKPALPAELVARIRALLARSSYVPPATTQSKTKTIAFMGVKGGVGTTTLAVNVAVALAQGEKAVAIADLNLTHGVVGWMLGLQTPPTLLAIWKENDKKPTPEMVKGCLVGHPTGLKVFLAPTRADAAQITVSPARVKMIINELKSQGDYLFLDVGACLNPLSITGLASAEQIIIVSDTDDLSMELLQQSLATLQQYGLHAAAVAIVMVNRGRSASVISKSEAEQRLNIKVASFIIPAPELCFQALRNRQPMILTQPGNLAVEQIRDLAEHLIL